MGKELPYTPYMSEELLYLNEVHREISEDTEVGKLLRWYENGLKTHKHKGTNARRSNR